MKTIKIGLIGSGFVTHLHLNAFRQVVGIPVQVVAVASLDDDLDRFAKKFNIPHYYSDYRKVLQHDEIDMIDVCVPNVLHKRVCIDAAEAGKHIICEKPLTGYFGEDLEDKTVAVGETSKLEMYKKAVKNADEIMDAVQRNNVKLCYAEDFVYAPPVTKAKRLLEAAGGTILELRSEESHSGSHAAYSREWRLSGGGSLMRLGSHPLGLVIHLKNFEGKMKYGKPIKVKSLTAEVGNLTRVSAFQKEEKKWMVDRWKDVEDWAAVFLTFEDGTKGVVFSNDITLGGIVNTLAIYSSNAVIKVDMAANDAIKAYAPAHEIFGDEYISEKIETKAGWTFPSPDEDWMRGYPQEMQDFVEAVYYGRDPVSDGELGRQVVEVTYAAYLSAEEGRRIDLDELNKEIGRNR
ncbi:MAG: Gfo/Idh/MocA family oxidoreductase [Bacillota bacterium]|jgi:predicted dehydrogenase|nr:Gfo/Idh/MocA family oxidoreductase [Bacillota bacterium]MDI9415032.1 Gfo/Idh/MocA family oxidoreductase [Bacillota bacterium]NLD12635.1 Gfo/Idh/MocA family oxidoreductase [Bacillota bacterium]HCD41944.1 oxidoreductase [Bacillota bacterium]HOB88712.1 Gfo/Idh/MocA family oxidoreductase [Bacillota bacterium]